MTASAVYAGSFDPPTRGHEWLIHAAAELFDGVIVGVAMNPDKRYTFSLERRLAWLNEMCEGMDHVEVADIGNVFLAHYARDRGARFILRGIRNEADHGYERAMRYVNADLAPAVTSVFMMPPRELCEISSSFVKGMVGPAGWEEVVRAYVPPCVFEGLKDLARAEGTRGDGI